MNSNSPIRFAVFGPQGRGRMALYVHRPEENLRIVAVCSDHLNGLEKFDEKCGPDLIKTTDPQEILKNKDIDAVFVCTPDFLHAEHAIACLNAGKHVFLEKPMAITIEDCDRIMAAAERSGAKLFVGHNMRFFPVILKMKELIDSGRIGRVEAVWCRHFISYGGDAYFKDWHSEQKYATSLLLQKGAHDIDVIHFLAGGHTTRVVGMGKLSVYNEVKNRRKEGEKSDTSFIRSNWPPLSQTGLSPKIDVEDHSMILMQLDNGVQASYLQCHYTPDDTRNYTIIGTEGRIENYGDHSDDNHWATVHLWNRRMGYQEHGNEVYRIPILKDAHAHGGSDPLLLNAFVDFIRTGKRSGATPEDARSAVAVGYLGAESLRNGSVPKDIPAIDRSAE